MELQVKRGKLKIDPTKKHVLLVNKERVLNGKDSNRVLWSVRPVEMCKPFVIEACRTLGLELATKDDMPRGMYSEAFVLTDVRQFVETLGLAVVTYQGLTVILKKERLYEQVSATTTLGRRNERAARKASRLARRSLNG